MPSGSLYQRSRLAISALAESQSAQIAQALCNFDLVASREAFTDRDRSHDLSFRIVVTAHVFVEEPQVVKACGDEGILRPERLLEDGARAAVIAFGIVETVMAAMEDREVV